MRGYLRTLAKPFLLKKHWLPWGRGRQQGPTTYDGSLGDDGNFDLRRPRPAGIWIGVPMAGMLCFFAWQAALRGRAVVGWLVIAGICFGAGVLIELRGHRRWQQTMAELERARRDLPHLRRDLADEVARGQGIVQRLRDRGYSHFDVRRWIERQLRTPPPS